MYHYKLGTCAETYYGGGAHAFLISSLFQLSFEIWNCTPGLGAVAAVEDEVSTKARIAGSAAAAAIAFWVDLMAGVTIRFGSGLKDRSLATCTNALTPVIKSQ